MHVGINRSRRLYTYAVSVEHLIRVCWCEGWGVGDGVRGGGGRSEGSLAGRGIEGSINQSA